MSILTPRCHWEQRWRLFCKLLQISVYQFGISCVPGKFKIYCLISMILKLWAFSPRLPTLPVYLSYFRIAIGFPFSLKGNDPVRAHCQSYEEHRVLISLRVPFLTYEGKLQHLYQFLSPILKKKKKFYPFHEIWTSEVKGSLSILCLHAFEYKQNTPSHRTSRILYNLHTFNSETWLFSPHTSIPWERRILR